MRGVTIDKKFMHYELAINNAMTKSELLEALSIYGYNETRMKEGKGYLDDAIKLYEQHKTEYADKYGTADSLKKKTQEAYKIFMKTVKVARIAYKNDVNSQKRLALGEERKKTFSGWIDQAERMYKNFLGLSESNVKVNNIDKEAISKFGYNIDKLSKEYELIKKVKDLNMNHKSDTGTAQNATEKKDESIKIIDEWMSDFIKIARIALEDNKQMLEQLGITVKTVRSNKSDDKEDGSYEETTDLLEDKTAKG
jgi:biotin operon repressor